MTSVDWLIVAFTALLAIYGYVQGFIVGFLSLVGFGLGAFLGTRLAPLLLHQGSRSPYSPLFGLFGALLAGGIMASGLEGLGARVRGALRLPGLQAMDGLLGAALTACVALGVAWVIGAVAVQSSGSARLRRDIQRSAILRELNHLLPPSGPILDALARIDPLPSVHGPVASVSAPTRRILANPAIRAARRSVVRVFGTACGLGVEGTGWVAAPGIVVTNAHVVAGETDTAVQVNGGGPGLPVTVVAFDVHDDLAVLRVSHVALPPLPMAPAAPMGAAAAILGYPLDGPFDAEPARLGQTETVNTENAYGVGRVQRAITSLRGRVRPGNSGGPVLDARGRVLATVFAALTGTPQAGGFAVPNFLVRAQLAHARGPAVGTGRCGG
ncbi:MAG TPA: MarP family serine protease [Solirubrobacteraceae bacterium]